MKDDPDTNVHFVKMIERNPCVYNRQCRDYSNKTKQDEAWENIGETFDATVPECKERWKNLRACFTRDLKLKSKPGYSPITKKPYYLAQHLNFLRPFTKSRNQNGDLTIPASSSTKDEVHEKENCTDNLSENEQHNNESATLNEVTDPNIHDSSDTNFTQTDQQQVYPSDETKLTSASTKKRWVDLEDVNEAVAKLFTKKRKTNITNEEDLDLCFFKSLLPDVRQMTPDQKRRFKVGVINLSGTILNEEIAPISDYNNIKREYQNTTECPSPTASTMSFNLSSQRFIMSLETNKDNQRNHNIPKPTLPSNLSTQKNVFPLSISKQSLQCMPEKEVPSTTNYDGNLKNAESRPNSALSILSSSSSILEYKVSAGELGP